MNTETGAYEAAGRAPAGEGSQRMQASAHGLDQSCMGHLIGYHVTQANVASRKAFSRHIGEPWKLSHPDDVGTCRGAADRPALPWLRTSAASATAAGGTVR